MTDFDTEHIGNAILVRTEQNLTGHQHVRRYTTIGRHPYWSCSANGWRACQGHTVAVMESIRTLPCRRAGHPAEERVVNSAGHSYCRACVRERYVERKAA